MNRLKRINTINKIKGFTLIELTVAMLISGLAVAAALSAFLTIESYYFRLKDRNESVSEILLFQNVIKQDFKNADRIYYSEKRMVFNEMQTHSAEYFFEDFEVIRKKISTDTFRVEAELLKVYTDEYNQKTLTGADLIVLSEKIEMPIHLRKKYTQEQLFLHSIEDPKDFE